METGQVQTPTKTSSADYRVEKWNEAILSSKQRLAPQDFEKILSLPSWETFLKDLQQKHNESTSRGANLLLQRMTSYALHLRNIITILAVGNSTRSLEVVFIWGLINLALELCLKCASIQRSVADLIDDLGHSMEVFQLYEWVFQADPAMEAMLMDILVDTVDLWVSIIRPLRKTTIESVTRTAWGGIQEEAYTITKRIDKRIGRLKEKAEALSFRDRVKYQGHSDLSRQLETLDTAQRVTQDMTQTDSAIDFPCHNIPFPRNPHFFGREATLAYVRETLDHSQDSKTLKSMVIWGMGGLGKTQLALEYAHERLSRGVSAVIWVNSESVMDAIRSITQIARMLNLKTTDTDESHSQDRLAVLNWLQKTNADWLLIFDNVEGFHILREYWPVAPRGSILITSRSDLISEDFAGHTLEVPVFQNSDACKFLLEVIGRKSYSVDELKAAEELVEGLGGLALAINLMAKHIRYKRLNITKFLDNYHKNMRRYHEVFPGGRPSAWYRHSQTTAWETTFGALDNKSSLIFGTICLISPDDISENMFAPEDATLLPSTLQFCEDPWELDEALQNLLNLALAKRDPDSGTFQVHRIIQQEFRYWIGPKPLLQNFKLASKLLLEVFPKQVNGRSLRNRWSTCKKYIQHVLALCTRVRDKEISPVDPGDFRDFTELLTNAAWYLLEIASWSEFSDLMKIALNTCEDKHSILYAHLCCSAAVVEMEQAHLDKARPFFEACLKIRSDLLPEYHEEIANDCNNYANLLIQESREPDVLAEAERLYLRAIEIDEKVDAKKPEDERGGLLYIKCFGLGTVYAAQHRYQEAIDTIEKGRWYATRALGVGSHWDATASYQVGNVLYAQGKWDSAKGYFEQALDLFTAENPFHPTTSASQLKLAKIAMKQGEDEFAVGLLRKTRVVCEFYENLKGDQGDTARVLRALAEALAGLGEHSESEQLKSQAEEIRRRMQGPRFDELPDCEQSYNLLVYQSFW